MLSRLVVVLGTLVLAGALAVVAVGSYQRDGAAYVVALLAGVAALAAMVWAARRGRAPRCPACMSRVHPAATVCPRCRTAIDHA